MHEAISSGHLTLGMSAGNDCMFPQRVRLDRVPVACTGEDWVRFSDRGKKVRSVLVADLHRRESSHGLVRQRQAKRSGGTHDRDALVEQRSSITIKQFHDTTRRVRSHGPSSAMYWIVCFARENMAIELRTQAIRMFLRINSLQNRTAVDNLGERQLHNNAMHVLIAIHLLEL